MSLLLRAPGMFGACLVLLPVILLGNPSIGVEPPGGHGVGSPALRALLDEHVEWVMRENPTLASTRGDDRFAGMLRDESPGAYARRLGEVKDRLRRLDEVDVSALGEQDRLDADLLRYELSMAVDGAGFYPEQMPINALDGPHIWLAQLPETTPVRTPVEREGYVRRLEQVALQLGQIEEQMRAGLAAGRTPPRVVLERTMPAMLAQASKDFEEHPEASPFYRPFAGAGKEDALAARARGAIASGITPAFAHLATFMRETYIPGAVEDICYSHSVNGVPGYDFELRRHTTLSLSAKEIHEIGLREVASLRAQMLACARSTGFDPGKKVTDEEYLAAFIAYLRDDPASYFNDEGEMLRAYRDIAKRIDPELPKLFRTLPRNTYGVAPIPKFASESSPAAYYYPGSIHSGTPGNFMVNVGNLRQRPKFAMLSLTMHEAVPGHHLQGSISDELEGVHPIHQITNYSAYVEGWAVYCERLGLEMGPNAGSALDPTGERKGFYSEPRDNFGRLSDEIWRACRLVVDTGIHSLGWSRQRAIDYLLANTAISGVDAASEVDRYIGWPGQACAYKLGQLQMLAMRTHAQEALGQAFDVREFHDALLSEGALPLPVLRARMDRWVERKAGHGPAAGAN